MSFESLERIRFVQPEFGHEWPVLSDEGAGIYEAYGLGRSVLRSWLMPRTLGYYAREAIRGRRPRIEGDTARLGGDFVIDPAGIIRFAHASREPADRPAIDTILRALVP